LLKTASCRESRIFIRKVEEDFVTSRYMFENILDVGMWLPFSECEVMRTRIKLRVAACCRNFGAFDEFGIQYKSPSSSPVLQCSLAASYNVLQRFCNRGLAQCCTKCENMFWERNLVGQAQFLKC
jgi:hypothetical protein